MNLTGNSPSVTFQSITFSDGTTIELGPTDIVVFIGPNNAGKSLALRELQGYLGSNREAIVIKSTQLHKTGTQEDLRTFLDKNVVVRTAEAERGYYGYRFSLPVSLIQLWPDRMEFFSPIFCMHVQTETRITDSNPVNSIERLHEPPSHPIHMLYDDRLEKKISNYFRAAFGEDLILFHLGGQTSPLLVGKRPSPNLEEDRLSNSYNTRLLESTVPLQEQGDGMRSFASVILHLLAPITPTILLLDEPEAFLHPPQARLLGEIIAQEKSPRAQLFVSTHSADVLNGLINVAPNHLRVLRIQREGKINRVKELDKGLVQKISTDPLMKYSSVMSGMFHERVIICESDADCMFYSTILDLKEVRGERQPDVLFVHANGKDRMAALAQTLVALNVPVDIIADIDVFRDEVAFQKIIESVKGNWAKVRQVAKEVRAAIEQRRTPMDISEVKTAIQEKINADHSGDFLKLRSEIDTIFRNSSPWGLVKTGGAAALPGGHATEQFNKLRSLCAEIGLWVVDVGELEGFCKSVGLHGPPWVQQVIEQKNLADDSELEPARKFMREIWASR